MNACSHLFVCKGVSQQRSSKCSSVSCNCCVLDCPSEFFCAYVGQKPDVSRSVLLFPSVCWGVVGAGGFSWVLGWKGRSLFCHRTSSPMDVALSLSVGVRPWWLQIQWLEVRLLPGPHLFWGSGVFWGSFVVLRWLLTFYEHLAKELVLSFFFTIITIIIFNNINTQKKT